MHSFMSLAAGMSLHVLPTTHATGKQGTTEELDIIRDGDTIVLITGLTKVEFGRQNVGALADEELNWVVDSVQNCESQITDLESHHRRPMRHGRRRVLALPCPAENFK